MKLLFLLLLPCITFGQSCPREGDSQKQKIIAADLLKNRSEFPDSSTAFRIDILDLLMDQVPDTFVSVEAYIVDVKLSGPESCECHSTDPAERDFHIFISDRSDAHKIECAVIEMTRYSRNISLKDLRKLVGHKVLIYGYTFFDEEHRNAIGRWRAGISEIHPVQYIIDKN